MKNLALLIPLSCTLFYACENNDDNNENIFQEPIKIELSAMETKMANEGNTFAAELFSVVNENETDEYLASTALPYGNGAYSMVFILPQPNVSFDNVLEQLKQPDYWNRCLNPAGSYEVNLYVPKFKIEYEKELNKMLEQLGMGIAFSDWADFSRISDIPLKISKVKQKACIEVNEEGSEVAAVTVVEMVYTTISPSPQKVTFRANRPFLFAIKENSTGTVLFMGKIGEPK